MDSAGGGADPHRSLAAGAGAIAGPLRRYSLNLSASNLIQAPLAALLEYSGIAVSPTAAAPPGEPRSPLLEGDGGGDDGEVSIHIVGSGEYDGVRDDVAGAGAGAGAAASGWPEGERRSPVDMGTPVASGSGSPVSVAGSEANAREGNAANANGDGDRAYQRYDVHRVARWIDQILPFSLLLLVVFIRQHLQGFFVTIWIAAVMFKSNDIVRKQTALKGERKFLVLIGISVFSVFHVLLVYWWYNNDDFIKPLFMLPPKEVPPFWHAIFIILVNDTMVRQAAMAVKCLLLMYYKNSRGRNYRRQGQMLTLVEYFLLLYRGLLPAPVWYRFFLNKENGSLFSSLTTGLYLTFKLTSVVEKVQSFLVALKALSCTEVNYGSYATAEQVLAASDMCAICQEKLHIPVLLRCKHIFCEDCVSEWFERERTCPLCRALVKPADIRSFADGSTSLQFQIF